MSHTSKVWEDNTGTHKLANFKVPVMYVRNKHICIKYHWCQSMVKTLVTEILRISTKEQRAEIFTKGLTRFNFKQVRKTSDGLVNNLIVEYLTKRKCRIN